MKLDYQDELPDTEIMGETKPGTQKISMSQAARDLAGKDSQSSNSQLDILNQESQASGLGALFERVTVPAS